SLSQRPLTQQATFTNTVYNPPRVTPRECVRENDQKESVGSGIMAIPAAKQCDRCKTSLSSLCPRTLFIYSFNLEFVRWSSGQLGKEVNRGAFTSILTRTLDIAKEDIPLRGKGAVSNGRHHLFAIGSSAYGKMSKDGENQVVVIRYE
ncbi:hypothetical protein TNCV_1722961, partial [Trichonephila clavipes]